MRAADVFCQYLYDPSQVYQRPHWKRIANASELGVFPENYDGISFQEFVQGRENDGHASVMLMLCSASRVIVLAARPRMAWQTVRDIRKGGQHA